jgi:hypothetical protein
MTTNPVLDELHEARRKILADWNGNTGAYLKDAQIRLEQSGRTVWRGKQRTKGCAEADAPPKSDGSSVSSAG